MINAEDDMDEMLRRLAAAAREMKADVAALEGRLFLAETPESIVIARMDNRSKSIVRTPLVEDLVKTIEQEGIGFVVADPFAETFEGDENSNSEVKWAGVLWREVARRTGCALMLVHHTRKYAGGMAGDADASRGGGALIGIARILSTLFAMTEEEAIAMAVPGDEEQDHARPALDDAGQGQPFKRWRVRAGSRRRASRLRRQWQRLRAGVMRSACWRGGCCRGRWTVYASCTISGWRWDTIDQGHPGRRWQARQGRSTPSRATASPRRAGSARPGPGTGHRTEAAAKLLLKEWVKKDVP